MSSTHLRRSIVEIDVSPAWEAVVFNVRFNVRFFEACPPPKIRIRECEGVSNGNGDGNGIGNGDGIVNCNCGGGRVSWFFIFRVSWFFNFRFQEEGYVSKSIGNNQID